MLRSLTWDGLFLLLVDPPPSSTHPQAAPAEPVAGSAQPSFAPQAT
ncbi:MULTISPECIES: hypothetical protein [unclassified Mycolicibacterium]|nr:MULTISPECIES: hypothetical protein [unclassified Mycolicibacterium]